MAPRRARKARSRRDYMVSRTLKAARICRARLNFSSAVPRRVTRSATRSTNAGKDSTAQAKVVSVGFVLEYAAAKAPSGARGKGKGKSICTDSGQGWDALFYKQFRVDTEGGGLGPPVTSTHIRDRSEWMESEIMLLMVFRCTAEDQFKEACHTPKKHSVKSLWEEMAKQIPKEEGREQKSGTQCQWMWNMLLRDFTDVLVGKKSQDAFPYFKEFKDAWSNCRP